jgi:hypothetical protein
MPEAVFADESHPPTDAELSTVLGSAQRHWDDLIAHIREAHPGATAEWKHHGAKYGWSFVVREKRRNLAYFKPLEKGVLVSLALGEKAVQAAEQSSLPDDVMDSIRQAPKYAEGRPVRVKVISAGDVGVVKKLLGIKTATG